MEWYYVKWCLRHPIEAFKQQWQVKQFPPGTLIENCAYHPCIISEISEDGGIWAYDIVGKHMTGCSLFHCGIIKITAEEVEEMVKIYDAGGNEALTKFREEKWNSQIKS